MHWRWLAVSLLVAATRPAAADDNDLTVSRLGTVTGSGTAGATVVPDQLAFRSLASQLGVVLAPHLLTPADTIGFGGFQFTVDASTTTIDQGAKYWRALDKPTGSMGTLGVFVRKGLWLPLPSFEVGIGAVHLDSSQIWAAQLYTKLGVHEGYHDLPLPSVSVRGSVSRVMNQREIDLTVASLDITVSKHVGVGGTWRFDPYAGWNYLWIVPRSEVLDGTPTVDALGPANMDDAKLNFIFRDESAVTRTRLFVGAKSQYGPLQLALEFQLTFAGNSVDDVTGATGDCTAAPTVNTKCDVPDTARAQTGLSLSAGFDF
jgi:hypothetical protein|nr:hypothetical protein [Kofleriaceae bacterium]